MKEYETLVKDIIQEENELKDKINRLEYFMMTEDFQNIAIAQKALLRKQLSVMTEYKSILIDRVIRIRHEHEENKGKECEPEPEKEETQEEDHRCYNCKHGELEHSGPGRVSYSCKCAIQCHEYNQWEKR